MALDIGPPCEVAVFRGGPAASPPQRGVGCGRKKNDIRDAGKAFRTGAKSEHWQRTLYSINWPGGRGVEGPSGELA